MIIDYIVIGFGFAIIGRNLNKTDVDRQLKRIKEEAMNNNADEDIAIIATKLAYCIGMFLAALPWPIMIFNLIKMFIIVERNKRNRTEESKK